MAAIDLFKRFRCTLAVLRFAIWDGQSHPNLSPTITSGAGVPTADEPAGSVYLRTNGGFYTTAGGGVWTTPAAGADFGATGLLADEIGESTATAGITLDGVLLKDGLVDGIDVAARDADLTQAEADIVTAQAAVDAVEALPIPQLLALTIDTTDLDESGTGQIITVGEIPAGSIVLASGVDKQVDFSGGTVNACTAKFGLTGTDDAFVEAEDVFTGAGAGRVVDRTATRSVAAATDAIVTFASTNGDLDTLTAGQLTAWVSYITVPVYAVPE